MLHDMTYNGVKAILCTYTYAVKHRPLNCNDKTNLVGPLSFCSTYVSISLQESVRRSYILSHDVNFRGPVKVETSCCRMHVSSTTCRGS